MKSHIAVGSALFLTLGTAMAGALMFRTEPQAPSGAGVAAELPSPEVISAWKATSKTADEITPKVPI